MWNHFVHQIFIVDKCTAREKYSLFKVYNYT